MRASSKEVVIGSAALAVPRSKDRCKIGTGASDKLFQYVHLLEQEDESDYHVCHCSRTMNCKEQKVGTPHMEYLATVRAVMSLCCIYMKAVLRAERKMKFFEGSSPWPNLPKLFLAGYLRCQRLSSILSAALVTCTIKLTRCCVSRLKVITMRL